MCFVEIQVSMEQDRDPQCHVTFGDVLLARRYRSELRETGKLSPDLETAVDKRGREHVQWVASILGHIDKWKVS